MQKKEIHIKGARVNNLQNIDLDIPIGKFVGITGISGSGKDDDNNNKKFEGNRPSSIIIGDKLDPKTMGALLSHFEKTTLLLCLATISS